MTSHWTDLIIWRHNANILNWISSMKYFPLWKVENKPQQGENYSFFLSFFYLSNYVHYICMYYFARLSYFYSAGSKCNVVGFIIMIVQCPVWQGCKRNDLHLTMLDRGVMTNKLYLICLFFISSINVNNVFWSLILN